MRRKGLSLRATTTKIKRINVHVEKLKKDKMIQVKRITGKYQIHPKYIINVDETPMYWE